MIADGEKPVLGTESFKVGYDKPIHVLDYQDNTLDLGSNIVYNPALSRGESFKQPCAPCMILTSGRFENKDDENFDPNSSYNNDVNTSNINNKNSIINNNNINNINDSQRNKTITSLCGTTDILDSKSKQNNIPYDYEYEFQGNKWMCGLPKWGIKSKHEKNKKYITMKEFNHNSNTINRSSILPYRLPFKDYSEVDSVKWKPKILSNFSRISGFGEFYSETIMEIELCAKKMSDQDNSKNAPFSQFPSYNNSNSNTSNNNISNYSDISLNNNKNNKNSIKLNTPSKKINSGKLEAALSLRRLHSYKLNHKISNIKLNNQKNNDDKKESVTESKSSNTSLKSLALSDVIECSELEDNDNDNDNDNENDKNDTTNNKQDGFKDKDTKDVSEINDNIPSVDDSSLEIIEETLPTDKVSNSDVNTVETTENLNDDVNSKVEKSNFECCDGNILNENSSTILYNDSIIMLDENDTGCQSHNNSSVNQVSLSSTSGLSENITTRSCSIDLSSKYESDKEEDMSIYNVKNEQFIINDIIPEDYDKDTDCANNNKNDFDSDNEGKKLIDNNETNQHNEGNKELIFTDEIACSDSESNYEEYISKKKMYDTMPSSKSMPLNDSSKKKYFNALTANYTKFKKYQGKPINGN